jgi:predicted dehydrogenase
MKSITRRNVIKGSLAAGLSLSLPLARVRGANDDIRVAVVGIRNQGSNHIGWFNEMKGVRVVAVCDPDRTFLDREKKKAQDRNETVDTYLDYRKLLEDKSIDVIVTASPNHWHALVTVWGCQAGKDVYVEKPVSHDIWEGRQMVNAARRHNRIVQAGTQRRSDAGLQEAIEYIRQGNLGKMKLVRGICYVRRDSIGKVAGPQPVPESVDYDLWCGPAPKGPLLRRNLHYDWHWVWPTGNGDFRNNGIHFIDICRWVIDRNQLPPSVISLGGRFGYIDDGETPNTQLIYYDYKPVPILFELRGLGRKQGDSVMDHYRDTRAGVVVECEGGWFCGGWAYDNDGKKLRQFQRDDGGSHKANFIKAVRSRKPSDLTAEVLEGHLSSALCHMGNISHCVGKEASAEQVAQAVKGNSHLEEALGRLEEHLSVNRVNFQETPRILGACLQMDPAHETFTGDFSDQANRLLKRPCRHPFVIPEEV